MTISMEGDQAVARWLMERFGRVVFNQGYPDFVIHREEKKYGFEVSIGFSGLRRVRNVVYRASNALLGQEFSEMSMVFVLFEPTAVQEFKELLANALLEEIPDNLHLILGIYGEVNGFIPFNEVLYHNTMEQIRSEAQQYREDIVS